MAGHRDFNSKTFNDDDDDNNNNNNYSDKNNNNINNNSDKYKKICRLHARFQSRSYSFHYSNILLLFLFGIIAADEIEHKLTRHLLTNYDPSVRPAKNYSESLQVIFGVSLHHIIDVDEKNQILTTNCWITHLWTDYQLEWNVTEYSGIKVIRMPYDKVWRPDIILYNNADSQYNQAVINTNVIVSHTGLVLWLSHGIYRSSCDIDVEYFPFDVQSCTLKWASWTYDGYQLDLNKQSEEGDTTNYKANGEFDLVSFDITKNVVNYSCCAEPYPDITYTIRLRRRPMFYVFNLILPCILINCIALLVFYVPSESGEKVTLGISALLSMTVFLMTIRETLPPTEKTPLISMYYGVSICLVTFASGLSVVTLNVYHRGVRGTKVPVLIKRIVLEKLAKLLLLQFEQTTENNNSIKPTTTATTSETITCQGPPTYSATKFLDIDDEAGRLHNCNNNNYQNVRPPYSPIFVNNKTKSNRRASCNNPPNAVVKVNSTDTESQFIMTLNHVRQSIERNEFRLTDHETRELTEREWKQVSLVCDRFLLVIFMVATVITTVVILCGSPYGP